MTAEQKAKLIELLPLASAECDGNKHDLEEVFSMSDAPGYNIVRWCRDCGAVVVDRDCDNRTYSGYCVPMKFPRMTYPNQTTV